MRSVWAAIGSATLCFSAAVRAEEGEGVPALIEQLSESGADVREQALSRLAELGPAASDAVPEIAGLLSDHNPRVRREALMAIERIGAKAGAAVVELTRILERGPPAMRVAAIQALGAIGPEAQPTVDQLVRLSESGDLRLATASVLALARIEPARKERLEQAIPILNKALRGSDSAARNDAFAALAEIGSPAETSLIAAVENYAQDKIHAARAAAVLSAMADPPEAAVPALVAALNSRDAKLQEGAAAALGAIGAEAGSSATALIGLLESPTPAVQATAAMALGRIGVDRADALPALLRLTRDRDPLVRREAVRALGASGFQSEEAIAALVQALRDEQGAVTVVAAAALAEAGAAATVPVADLLDDANLRSLALQILGDLGEHGGAAVPRIIGLLKESDPQLVLEAHLALANIGQAAKAASGQLIAQLTDEKSRVRASAAYALVRIGERQETLPLLKETVTDADDAHLRAISAWGLVQLQPEEDSSVSAALPELTRGLASDWALVRRESAVALRALGRRAAPAEPHLLRALTQEKDPHVRYELIRAIADAGITSEEAVQLILQAMGDPDAGIRYSAYYAAGTFGPAAKKVVPLLTKSLQDERDSFLAFLSAWALVRINGEDSGLPDDVVPVLIQGLQLSDSRARAEAARALAAAGARASPALEALQPLAANDPEEAVRQAAAEAIARIRAQRPGSGGP